VKKPDTFTITTFWMDWLLLPIMAAGRQAGLWLGAYYRADDERDPQPGASPNATERHLGGLRHGCVATGAGCARPERRVRDLFYPGGAGR